MRLRKAESSAHLVRAPRWVLPYQTVTIHEEVELHTPVSDERRERGYNPSLYSALPLNSMASVENFCCKGHKLH